MVIVIIRVLPTKVPPIHFQLIWGIAGGIELGVSRWNGNELLLNVNAMGPLVSYDSLESPSKVVSLTLVREGEGEGAMDLAVSSFLLLAQLNGELVAVAAAAGSGQRGNGPLTLS